MFQRLQSRDLCPGSGIGLALYKEIAELHGGRIWFESDGQGTSCYFTLPMLRDAANQVHPSPQ